MHRAGITEIAVVGDRPDLVAAVQARYLPNAVLAWGEPYDSPLWEDRRDGLGLRLPGLRLSGPGRHRRDADWTTRRVRLYLHPMQRRMMAGAAAFLVLAVDGVRERQRVEQLRRRKRQRRSVRIRARR